MPETPVTISIVGTGNGTGGGDAPTPNQTIAKTPGEGPNLLVNVVPPMMAVLVRFLNTFLTSFVGLLTAAGFGVGTTLGANLQGTIREAATVSLVIAAMATLKNLITIFGRMEGKYPLATGSI